MSEQKWEVTWNIFGYKLGWYAEKLYKFIPIHMILSIVTVLPILIPVLLNLALVWIITGCVFTTLLIGSYIEWTQNDKTGKKWIDRKDWFLGSVRDVITYPLGACLLYLLLLIK